MIPGALCLHYWPGLRSSCDAGLRAPADCHGCPAYHDGTPYLGVSQTDSERERRWSDLHRSPPHAYFRGQPLVEGA
jgi:hypothetical protein